MKSYGKSEYTVIKWVYKIDSLKKSVKSNKIIRNWLIKLVKTHSQQMSDDIKVSPQLFQILNVSFQTTQVLSQW